MKDILNNIQLAILEDRGSLTIKLPYQFNKYSPMEKQGRQAALWLNSEYNLNWGNASVVGVEVDEKGITIRLMDKAVLEMILIETGLGGEIFSQFEGLQVAGS